MKLVFGAALQAHKDAEQRRKEGLAMSSELLQELMREPAVAPFIHGLAGFCLAPLHVWRVQEHSSCSTHP